MIPDQEDKARHGSELADSALRKAMSSEELYYTPPGSETIGDAWRREADGSTAAIASATHDFLSHNLHEQSFHPSDGLVLRPSTPDGKPVAESPVVIATPAKAARNPRWAQRTPASAPFF